MSKFKENALESMLYCLHGLGHTPEAAHAQLLKMNREEAMSREDVVDFFGKITHGTYGIKEIDEESKLHLTQQVDEVYNKIMENLNLNGRLSLLKTCKQLRDVSRTRELHIKTLTINFSTNYFQLLTDDGFNKTFLLVKHTKNTHVHDIWKIGYSSFMDEIKTELRNVFQFDAIRIDSLNLMRQGIGEIGEGDDIIKEVFESMQSVLSSRKVEVKSLKSNWPLADVWQDFVPIVGGLKNIKILEEPGMIRTHSVEPVEGVKDIERFTSIQSVPPIRIAQNLGHIPYCKIDLDEVLTLEVLIKLKEKLLLNPKLQQFKIRSAPSHDVYNKLNEHFKTNVMPGAQIPINQIFNYPGSQTEKLTFYATNWLFWFKGPCFKDTGEPDEELYGENYGFKEEDADIFGDWT